MCLSWHCGVEEDAGEQGQMLDMFLHTLQGYNSDLNVDSEYIELTTWNATHVLSTILLFTANMDCFY